MFEHLLHVYVSALDQLFGHGQLDLLDQRVLV